MRLLAKRLALLFTLLPLIAWGEVVYVPGAGKVELLHSQTFSAAASISFSLAPTTRCAAQIVYLNLMASADDSELYLRTDSDAGASFDDGAGTYRYTNSGFDELANALFAGSTSATQVFLTEDAAGAAIGNATGEHFSGRLEFMNLGSASADPLVQWLVSYITANGRTASMSGTGRRTAQAAINAVQIFPQSGTITGQLKSYCVNP